MSNLSEILIPQAHPRSDSRPYRSQPSLCGFASVLAGSLDGHNAIIADLKEISLLDSMTSNPVFRQNDNERMLTSLHDMRSSLVCH